MHQVTEKASRDMEACGWDDEFWEEIGLGDLVDGHHTKIGMHFFFFFALVVRNALKGIVKPLLLPCDDVISTVN